jgi:hypothetical protein
VLLAGEGEFLTSVLNEPMIEPGAVTSILVGVGAILIRQPYARMGASFWAERLHFDVQNAQGFIRASMWIVGLSFIGAGIAWQISRA